MVTDIRVEHRLPWEQRGVVVALEEKNCGGAQARRRWVEVEHALHRWLMQLRCREDHGPAYLTYYPVFLRHRRRACALRHKRPRHRKRNTRCPRPWSASRREPGGGAGGGARRTTTWLADEVSIDSSKPFPESFFNIDQKGCRKAGISAGTISSVSGIISRAYLHYGRGPRAGPTKSPREGP